LLNYSWKKTKHKQSYFYLFFLGDTFLLNLVLDIDGSFEILVDLYRKKKQEVEKNVKKLFYAADVIIWERMVVHFSWKNLQIFHVLAG